MANNYFRINKGIYLVPNTQPPILESKKGDLYFDIVDNKLKAFNGTIWEDVGGGGGIGQPLTIGDGLTGTSATYDGSAAVTINFDDRDTIFQIIDATDDTKKITFDVSGSTGTSTIIASNQTHNITLNLPNLDPLVSQDTLIAKETQDTLKNKTIDLTDNTLVATSQQLANAITDETGTDKIVFNTDPHLNNIYVDIINNPVDALNVPNQKLEIISTDYVLELKTALSSSPGTIPNISLNNFLFKTDVSPTTDEIQNSSSFKVKSTSGSLELNGVAGLTATTAYGPIMVAPGGEADVTIATSDTSSFFATGVSGDVYLFSGSGTDGSGNVDIHTGNVNNFNGSGNLYLYTGDTQANFASTGAIQINSGNAYNGFTGNLLFVTGQGQSSGNIQISTGPFLDTSGGSGNIILSTGTAVYSGGTRGYLSIDCDYVTVNNKKIQSLADPTSNQDAATKIYVDTGLGTKQATITGAATTITSSDLTVSRALISNASGKVAVSSVTDTELGYVSGVTSAIQTQLSNKEPLHFIPDVGPNDIFRGYLYQQALTTVTNSNIAASTAQGTITARSVATTNTLTKQVRVGYAVSTPAANQQCGVRVTQALWAIEGGFKFTTTFAYTDSQYNSGARQFYGLTATTGLLGINSTVTVSSLLNMIGVGSDAGDTALSIYHNDGTGTATKITLSDTDFPANRTAGAASSDIFSFELYNQISSPNVKYRIKNLTTGIEATGTLSADLPSSATFLSFQAIRTSGSSSNQCSIDLTKIGCYNLC